MEEKRKEKDGQAVKTDLVSERPPRGNRGQAPYSPSDSTDEMEWEDEFGINRLFGSDEEILPPSRRKVKGVPDKVDTSSSSDSESENENENDQKRVKGKGKSGESGSSSESSSSEEELEENKKGELSSPANPVVAGSRTTSQESGAAPQEKDSGENVQAKVKRYLEGVKAKNTSEIRERLGEDLIVYNSIQARYRRELMANNLLGGGRESL
jgi:hypothetical protein